jgi:hypothetical protein
MQQYCPTCQAAFPGAARCPRCDGLLFLPHEAADANPSAADAQPGFIRPTPSGRIAVGTILAMGLYLGLRKVVSAGVLATTPDPSAWWTSFEGLIAVFGVQAVAVLFGALVAGAGRTRGFPVGFAVGGLCGGLFLAGEVLAGTPGAELVLYLQPPTLALAGGLTGAVGRRVWPALPDLDIRPPAPKRSSSIQLAVEEAKNEARPTSWVRVLVGSVIIVVGVGMADEARLKIQRGSGGLFKVESVLQARFLSWQMATFAVLLGGVTAAAGTGAGLRHGLIAGGIGAAGVIGLAVSRGEVSPALHYWLSRLSVGGTGTLDPPAAAAVIGGVLAAAIVGGWLGGQVFLPLAPAPMRSRRLKMGD